MCQHRILIRIIDRIWCYRKKSQGQVLPLSSLTFKCVLESGYLLRELTGVAGILSYVGSMHAMHAIVHVSCISVKLSITNVLVQTKIIKYCLSTNDAD